MPLPLPAPWITDPSVRQNFEKLAGVFPLATELLQNGAVTAAKASTAAATTINGQNQEGTATTLARSDHNHALPAWGVHFGDRYASSPTSVASGAANRANYLEVWIPHRTTITGIRYRVGGTSSGNIRTGLYNSAGSNIAESATTAQAAANQVQDVSFASTVLVSPGLHYMAIIFSSSTATRTAVNGIVPSSEVTEGAFDLPASITVPTAQSAITSIMSTF